jgi:transposase-like protein
MNPQTPCGHHQDCPARGQVGQGNLRVHSRAEQRYQCTTWGQSVAATKGTPFYRVRTAADVVPVGLTLLSPGCPVQAIVAACGLDERPGAAWLTRAGQHCQQVPPHVGQHGQVDRQPVQADELGVKLVGRRVGRAMALAVPSRLWLGGVISPHRDLVLITPLGQVVRSWGRSLAILVCVEGLASSVTAFRHVFRDPVRTGHRGRPRLVLEEGWRLGPVVTRDVKRRVASVEQRVGRGTEAAIAGVLAATPSGSGMHTSSSERLNATVRASLAPLVRRGRAIAHTEAALTAGLWLVGCPYNCGWLHESRRQRAPVGAPWKWQERTPALAAGLTHHRWTRLERLRSPVSLPPWVAPNRRGRPSQRALHPALALGT